MAATEMKAAEAGTGEMESHELEKSISGMDELNDADLAPEDRVDMLRLGKQQVFRRTFTFWPIFGLTTILLGTWEYMLVSVSAGLINGGFAGLFYEYIGTSLCYTTVVLSLAEMASMAPTSGGTYHWVSEFAPPCLQKYLSYAAGWFAALGWLTGAASGFFVLATLSEALINVRRPDFEFTSWQFSLLMIALVLVFILTNILGARMLPMLQTGALIGHTVGWIITIATLWATAPRNSTADVFKIVVDGGGWNNIGLSSLVGTTSILFCEVGPDAAVHVAEETQNASWTTPRCMVWGYLYSVLLGLIMLVTLLFTIGDLDSALAADGPFQAAFTNTGSPGLTIFLTLILLFLIGAGNITAIIATSRETWAFARDGGLPFSGVLAKVSRSLNAPVNSLILTTILICILAFINIGSTAAFTIIVSLNVVGFLAGYILSIGCLLYCRLTSRPLPPSRFDLGRLSIPINMFAVAYSCLALVLSCFPVSVPVTAQNANYAPAILGGVVLIAAVSFAAQGRKSYRGPVVFVAGRRESGVELQKDR